MKLNEKITVYRDVVQDRASFRRRAADPNTREIWAHRRDASATQGVGGSGELTQITTIWTVRYADVSDWLTNDMEVVDDDGHRYRVRSWLETGRDRWIALTVEVLLCMGYIDMEAA